MKYIPLPACHADAWWDAPDNIRYDFARYLLRQEFGYSDCPDIDNLSVTGPNYIVRVARGGVHVEAGLYQHETTSYGTTRLKRGSGPDEYTLYNKALPAYTVLAGMAHPPTYWRQSDTVVPPWADDCSGGGSHACG